jgi:hypothetical protein
MIDNSIKAAEISLDGGSNNNRPLQKYKLIIKSG